MSKHVQPDPCPFCGSGGLAHVPHPDQMEHPELDLEGALNICVTGDGWYAVRRLLRHGAAHQGIEGEWMRESDRSMESEESMDDELTGDLDALNRAVGKLAHADAENRELRELVKEAYNVIDGLFEQQIHCYTCRFSDDRGICEAEIIRDRMSDLGIEVRG